MRGGLAGTEPKGGEGRRRFIRATEEQGSWAIRLV